MKTQINEALLPIVRNQFIPCFLYSIIPQQYPIPQKRMPLFTQIFLANSGVRTQARKAAKRNPNSQSEWSQNKMVLKCSTSYRTGTCRLTAVSWQMEIHTKCWMDLDLPDSKPFSNSRIFTHQLMATSRKHLLQTMGAMGSLASSSPLWSRDSHSILHHPASAKRVIYIHIHESPSKSEIRWQSVHHFHSTFWLVHISLQSWLF